MFPEIKKKCGVSTVNSDVVTMKKYCLFFFGFLALLFVLVSCSKEENKDELSEQDQKQIVLAMFNAGYKGVNQGMNNESAVATEFTPDTYLRSVSYPLNYNGTYVHPDGKGGSIELTIKLGGVINYNQDPYQCLGGFILIDISEKINHFRVGLTNGREVYLDTDQSVNFLGTFTLQPGCASFVPAESNFRIEGRYRCNGIEYDVQLMGQINANGSCDSISGIVNGLFVSYNF